MNIDRNGTLDEITCISEGVYSGLLTYGKIYEVLVYEKNKEQFKLRGDTGRVRWFPAACFVSGRTEVPKIVRVMCADDYASVQMGSVEVTICLSNGQQRWCFFTTPDILARLDGEKDLGTARLISYNVSHMIVVDTINRLVIELALRYIESQGEIIFCTKNVSL